MTLTERRAIFVYNAALLAATAAGAPVLPLAFEEREQPFKDQFYSVIEHQCGPNRTLTPKAAHDTWVEAYLKMGWTLGPYNPDAKTHPDMVPYEELGQLEQDKDAVYLALCDIARQWIY